MKTPLSNSLIPVILVALITSSTLNAQLLHYRFTGTVENQTATELLPGLSFAADEPIEGRLTIDPSEGYSIASPDLPSRNQIYLGAVSRLTLSIGEAIVFSPNGQFLDLAVFDTDREPNGSPYYSEENETGDSIEVVSLQPIPVSPASTLGADAADLGFSLTLTDSTGTTLSKPEFPAPLRLENFDTAYGIINRWHEPYDSQPKDIRFRIDSLELEATSRRPVMAEIPVSQTVNAGESLELTMQPHPGNRHLRSQWSRNGVSYPNTLQTHLRLENLQPQDSGTYRVTAWNSTGDRSTALARIQVDSKRHRVQPIALSGWNTDLIIAPGESPRSHPPFDGITGKWYAAGYRCALDGFPASGRFTSSANPQVLYELQPYESVNALWLPDYQESTGRLTLDQPTQFEFLSIASATGSSTVAATVRIVFADGSVSEWQPLTPQDWATRPGRSNHAAIAGLGRLETTGFGYGPQIDSQHGFGLFETEINLAELGLADHRIAALEFKKPDLVNAMGVFAVSGQKARLERQVHLEWPSDSDLRIFEVASHLEGPWQSVDIQQGVVGDRRLAAISDGPLPRYYRGYSAALERQTLALYSFDQNGVDRLGTSAALKSANPRYHSGNLVLSSESGQLSAERPRHFLEVKDMHYNNFSVAYVFRLAGDTDNTSGTLLGGGRRYQWLRLKLLDDRLAVILGDQEFTHVSDRIRIKSDQWHRLVVGVHTRNRVLRILWNGQVEETVNLPDGFRYQFRPANATDDARAFTFFDTSDSTPFLGNVDLLMATRRMLTQAEAQTVDQLLAANSVGDHVQRGRHLAWEANLDQFRLQSAPSALGPWTNESIRAATWQGRKVFRIDNNSPRATFRLVTRR